jgi:ATP-dependent RNA helicase RhlE
VATGRKGDSTASSDGPFESLGLRPSLLTSLERAGFTAPLEVQSLCIPKILARQALVAVAETGSGKTLAYGLPVMQLVKEREERAGRNEDERAPRALILTPTRELADQVTRVLKSFAHETRMRIRSLAGGVDRARQRRDLGGGCEILVATPGRLKRFMEQGRVSLAKVSQMVLDEADVLLEMGFLKEIEEIIGAAPAACQKLMFTATLPAAIEKVVAARFDGAEVLRTRAAHKPVDALEVKQVQVSPKRKLDELLSCLQRARPDDKVLVFANTKDRCARVAEGLAKLGEGLCVLHAGLEGADRRAQLKRFRSDRGRVLVSTDLAARGLDIAEITWVINYDMPRVPAHYLHRVGRTARVGRRGRVTDFVTPADGEMIETLRQRRVRKAPFELRESPGQVRGRSPDAGGPRRGPGGRRGGARGQDDRRAGGSSPRSRGRRG